MTDIMSTMSQDDEAKTAAVPDAETGVVVIGWSTTLPPESVATGDGTGVDETDDGSGVVATGDEIGDVLLVDVDETDDGASAVVMGDEIGDVMLVDPGVVVGADVTVGAGVGGPVEAPGSLCSNFISKCMML